MPAHVRPDQAPEFPDDTPTAGGILAFLALLSQIAGELARLLEAHEGALPQAKAALLVNDALRAAAVLNGWRGLLLLWPDRQADAPAQCST
jgi:hypothetical protein